MIDSSSIGQYRRATGNYYNDTHQYVDNHVWQERVNDLARRPGDPEANKTACLLLQALLLITNVAIADSPAIGLATTSERCRAKAMEDELPVGHAARCMTASGGMDASARQSHAHSRAPVRESITNLSLLRERALGQCVVSKDALGRALMQPRFSDCHDTAARPKAGVTRNNELTPSTRNDVSSGNVPHVRNAAERDMDVPSGRWMPGAVDALPLRTTSSSASIDLRSQGDDRQRLMERLAAEGGLSPFQAEQLEYKLWPFLDQASIFSSPLGSLRADGRLHEAEILDPQGHQVGELLLIGNSSTLDPGGSADHEIAVFGLKFPIATLLGSEYGQTLASRETERQGLFWNMGALPPDAGMSLNVIQPGDANIAGGNGFEIQSSELSSGGAFTPAATFILRDTDTGIHREMLLSIKLEGSDILLRHLGDGEFETIQTKEGTEFRGYRISVNESTGAWHFNGSPGSSQLDSTALRAKIDQGRSYVMIQGKPFEIRSDEHRRQYEIVVESAGGGYATLLPVYQEPLTRTWHLYEHNGLPVFSPDHLELLRELSVPPEKEKAYFLVNYSGVGRIFKVGTSRNNFAYDQVVEMGGRLIRVKACEIQGADAKYCAYDKRQPDGAGLPIVWREGRWAPCRADSSTALVQTSPQTPAEGLTEPDSRGLYRDRDGDQYIQVSNNYFKVYQQDSAHYFIVVEGSVRPLSINDGQFDVAIPGGGAYGNSAPDDRRGGADEGSDGFAGGMLGGVAGGIVGGAAGSLGNAGSAISDGLDKGLGEGIVSAIGEAIADEVVDTLRGGEPEREADVNVTPAEPAAAITVRQPDSGVSSSAVSSVPSAVPMASAATATASSPYATEIAHVSTTTLAGNTSATTRASTSQEDDIVRRWAMARVPGARYQDAWLETTNSYGQGRVWVVSKGPVSMIMVDIDGQCVPARARVVSARDIVYEIYDHDERGKPGYPIEWVNGRWQLEKESATQASAKLRNYITADMFVDDVGANELSWPDAYGLRERLGRKFLKVRGRFVEIGKLSGSEDRFFLQDGSKQIPLRYDAGEFRLEATSERLEVLREEVAVMRLRGGGDGKEIARNYLLHHLEWQPEEVNSLLSQYYFPTNPNEGEGIDDFAATLVDTGNVPDWAQKYGVGEVALYGAARVFGDFRARLALFPEDIDDLLKQPDIDATEYEKRFAELTDGQQLAVRAWTAIGGERKKVYSDGTPNMDARGIELFNYQLNEKLSDRGYLDPDQATKARNLNAALARLDALPGTYLRVDEYADWGVCPWNSDIKVGDVVTNFPRFMSVAMDKRYSTDAIFGLVDPDTHVLAFYLVDRAKTPVPLLEGAASLVPEHEALFRPDTFFRVKGIATANASSLETHAQVRVGVLLEEVSAPDDRAKNIHTGEVLFQNDHQTMEAYFSSTLGWDASQTRKLRSQFDFSADSAVLERQFSIDYVALGEVPSWAELYRRRVTQVQVREQLSAVWPIEYVEEVENTTLPDELAVYNLRGLYGEISFADFFAIRDFTLGRSEEINNWIRQHPENPYGHPIVQQFDAALRRVAQRESRMAVQVPQAGEGAPGLAIGGQEYDEASIDAQAGRVVYMGSIEPESAVDAYQFGGNIIFPVYVAAGRPSYEEQYLKALPCNSDAGEVRVMYEIELTSPLAGPYVSRITGDYHNDVIFFPGEKFEISEVDLIPGEGYFVKLKSLS
ncbi:hypothetical protein BamIOP4010DRAFT_3466 [Burkholderia ambifaria IOP40-10]|uniref:Uncharacterized protein n=1 Tax=Burkholderia ambifaria IOP40-10 TaxID=396596 RepID=B1FHF7_9BURK|nr:hypothetical protein [Burkholderia ambifaria]EDT03018.1 hypothetical protein BamIOP4010DRAFT_3466 [Burkholderia ambifaria IOP40-10]